MVKPEWGRKRQCSSCGTKFYDLRRSPVICPSCGSEVDTEALPRGRRSRGQAPSRQAEPTPTKAVEPEEAEELEVENEAEADQSEGAESESESEEDYNDMIEDASELGEDEDFGNVGEEEDQEDR